MKIGLTSNLSTPDANAGRRLERYTGQPALFHGTGFSGQSGDTVLFGAGKGWDPQQYNKFQKERLRPAMDLLNGIPVKSPKLVYDLGCGDGTVTGRLLEKWPRADVLGLDSSPEMLAKAKQHAARARFQQADLSLWQPQRKADVIYSNATLHWLPDHEMLFPRLMQALKPGGVLAVQMPRNFDAPSHQLMRETALNGPWREALAPVLQKTPEKPVMSPEDYYRILAPHCDQLQIWETEYQQVLEGENPVAEFTKGTWLKPFLDALDEPQRSEFETAYRERIREAYPPGPDGKTLFPFKRLFIVATAKKQQAE